MRLTRRQLLVTGVAGTAGCIDRAGPAPGTPSGSSRSPSGTDTDPSRSSAPTRTRMGSGTRPPEAAEDRPDSSDGPPTDRSRTLDASRSLGISEVRRRDGDDALSAEAVVLRSDITAERPPTLRFTITADEERTVSYYDCPPENLNEAVSTTSDNSLLLTGYDGASESQGCWHVPHETLNMGRPCYEETVTVARDGPFARTFTVWDSRENTACYPRERYRVDLRVDRGDGEDSSYRWSLFLDITT